ncbi:TadE/TadG family type IV pilus assembly protein [Streptomyces sp. A5-4]|uniref:TadE/TadG family type IV pilus assembly protein n=1 Tax=Streptomyces sp. A5-4 TaxID=3384771 RepID=UPI003DA81A64
MAARSAGGDGIGFPSAAARTSVSGADAAPEAVPRAAAVPRARTLVPRLRGLRGLRTLGGFCGKTQRDRGAAILEFTGFLPILLFVAMAAIQLGLAGYAASQAGTAARAAARTESLEPGSGAASGYASISGWMGGRTTISAGPAGAETVSGTAVVGIPSVLPGIGDFGPITRTVVMPSDGEEP